MTYRTTVLLCTHAAIYAACYCAAFLLRFEFRIPAFSLAVLLKSLPVVVVLKCAINSFTGEWRRGIRYATLSDLVRLVASMSAVIPLLLAVNLLFYQGGIIPRSVILMDWALSILGIAFLRSSVRVYRETIPLFFRNRDEKRTIIYGADAAGIAILSTVQSTAREYRVVAFIDDRRKSRGSMIDGIPVFGADDADQIIRNCRAEQILISSTVRGKRVRRIVEICSQAGISASVFPSVPEIVTGHYEFKMRDVTVSDLLRREPAQLDMTAIKDYVAGRRVLVTGAAGSIGSELCRQILHFEPRVLILVDRSENGMFAIEQELAARTHHAEIRYVVADVVSEAMADVMAEWQPELLFHAAAYKHVPLMEENIRESIRNNVLGTKNVADLSRKHEVESFVLISTDKAVNPSSVMGCTKLLAEKYIQSLGSYSQTRFMAVRFGNVLDSVGSVVPTFRDQIEARGPVTVTHPDMQRFFMTIPEAVQLVLQAGAIGNSGDLLVLDMGEPVRIADLAKDMIFLSGLKYPDDVDIVYTGVRPGEKLFEELFYPAERSASKVHEKIFCVNRRPQAASTINAEIASLRGAVNSTDVQARNVLEGIIAEYVAREQERPDGQGPVLRDAA